MVTEQRLDRLEHNLNVLVGLWRETETELRRIGGFDDCITTSTVAQVAHWTVCDLGALGNTIRARLEHLRVS